MAKHNAALSTKPLPIREPAKTKDKDPQKLQPPLKDALRSLKIEPEPVNQSGGQTTAPGDDTNYKGELDGLPKPPPSLQRGASHEADSLFTEAFGLAKDLKKDLPVRKTRAAAALSNTPGGQ